MANPNETFGGIAGAALGTLMGGDNSEAYQEGRLYSARTEDALNRARKTRLEAMALDAAEKRKAAMREQAAKNGDTDMLHMMDMIETGLSPDYANYGQGRLREQEYGFRKDLASMETPQDQRFRLGDAIQGKVQNPFQTVGSGQYVDLRAEEPDLLTHDLGASMELENEASAAASNAHADLYTEQRINPERFRSPSTAAGDPYGGAYGKLESGMMVNPDFDPSMPATSENRPFIPQPGGSKDPDTVKPLGTRERSIVATALSAATNTTSDLRNLSKLPVSVDIGWFGSGANTPSAPLWELAGGHIRRKLSTPEDKRYQTLLGNLGQQLAILEGMGRIPPMGVQARFDNLAFQPTDTVYDRMLKMASMRQTTENALNVALGLGALPPESAAQARRMITDVQDAVPYTVEDVLNFAAEAEANPNKTLRDVAAEQGIGNAGVEPSAEPAGLDAEGWMEVSPGVRIRRKPTVP